MPGARSRGTTPDARIHWPRTLLHKGPGVLRVEHLHYQRRASTAGELHCLLLDCSGSMLKRRNLALAKGLLLQLSEQLYRRRSELAVIAFAGREARMLQAPRKVAAFNTDWIAPIAGGGGSPLLSGLAQAERLLARAQRQKPGQRRYLWLFSDGRLQALPPRPRHADECLVVDFDHAALPLGRTARIAELWGAQYWHAEQWRRPD